MALILLAGIGVSRLVAQAPVEGPDGASALSPDPAVQDRSERDGAAKVEMAAPVPEPSPTPQATPAEAAGPTPAPSPEADLPPSPFAPRTEPSVVPAEPPRPTPTLRTSDVTFSTSPSSPPNEPMVAIGRPVERANYGGSGNRQALRLRSMPPETFTFDRASLRDVLRFLGESAGIPYIGIPDHSPEAQKLVTFRMTASPFTALESVARQNDVKLTYEDGVWFMRLQDANFERARKVEDENELVGVIYQLRYDPGDRVAFGMEGQTGTSMPGVSTGAGASSAAAGGVASSPQMPLQNSQYVFSTRAPKLVNDVRAMLGLKPLVYDKETGTLTDPEATASEIANAERQLLPRFDGSTPLAQLNADDVAQAEAAAKQSNADPLLPVYVPPQKPQVVYNPDNNILWVVATRKQHKWVAEYLSRVDKQQDLIAIEVKFVETKVNPKTDIGVNWANTFGTGLTVGGEARIGSADSPIGGINFARGRQSGSNTGDLDLSVGPDGQPAYENRVDPSSPFPGTTVDNNFSESAITGNIPYSAVLSLDQFSFTLQAFMEDRDSSLVQYPRVLTINNREVAITSAENTPVNAGVIQTQSGNVATQTGTLGYLPIGTQINILPKVIGEKTIALSVAVTISSIIGIKPVDLGVGENTYPVTSSRIYNANLQVESGYTLAVGGLEKVTDRNNVGGIPVLKDIPGLGYLFKNKNLERDRVNLIIFITPYIIRDTARTPGVGETPVSIVPQRPGLPPQPPTFTPEGRLAGGEQEIAEAFAWLEYQLRYFRQVNIEKMMSGESIEKLRGVISVARVLAADLQAAAGPPPYDLSTREGEQAQRADDLLADLNRVLAVAQEPMM